MISAILFATIILFIIIIGFKKNTKHKNLPPGPTGLPVIGTLPSKGTTFEEFAVDLQRKHGDIFSVQIGSRMVIFLMRYDLIKEAYAMPQISARPDLYTLQLFTRFSNTGIVFSSGEPWANARRFALRHLKDFGMGKSIMEYHINEEAKDLVKEFEQHVGTPMEVTNIVNVAILNVIWKLVAGDRIDLKNKSMQKLTSNVEDNLKIILGPMSLLDWFPWLINLPEFIQDKYFQTQRAARNRDEVIEFLEIVIKKHQETLDPENIRDYIDQYLIEMEKQKHDPNSTFRQDLLDLTVSILDMYSAGSETTSSTLRWLILYMAVHPEVQQKVHQEMDKVVPRDRPVELTDVLPYLEATIAEVNRHVSLVPFSVPHMATETVSVAGYTIPKDAVVSAYLKGCHYDHKLWDQPEEFRPERFLNSEGKFVSREYLVHFGTGRRACMGESVARMELKLMAAAVLRNFVIAAPEGVTLNVKHDEPDYKESVINFAKPYKVVLTKRI